MHAMPQWISTAGRRHVIAASLILALAAGTAAAAGRLDNPLKTSGPAAATWAELRADVVGDRPIRDGRALFRLEAPYRAEDAATVPVRIVQTDDARRIKALTLVIDENPAPVAATLTFGAAMGRVNLETRVRVDQYSNVRAIAETADGALWMVGRYVKGAGGCSAPAAKDQVAALRDLGRMRLRHYPPHAGRFATKVMVRHPNFSGLKRDQITQLFTPANFVHDLRVTVAEGLLFQVEGGISLSSDPTFRFLYDGPGDGAITVVARDTDGGAFRRQFPAALGDSG